MVAAYLQGLLKPTTPYGRRSLITEDIVLESMSADKVAMAMESSISADHALLPVMNEVGIRKTIESTGRRASRVEQLRSLDIYRVEQQLRDAGKIKNEENEVSLYQLYQIAEKEGIFDAIAEHEENIPKKPLI